MRPRGHCQDYKLTYKTNYMGIKLPLTGALDITHTDQGSGVGSVAGGWAYPFKLPQDTDNIIVKVLPSVVAGGVSVIFQTSDDGGSTYYDVARTSIASANSTGALPQFLSIPTIQGAVTRASVVAVGSVIAVNSMGPVAASTLGTGQYSGLPIMGLQNRIFLITTGNVTSINTRVQVLVNQQSATA